MPNAATPTLVLASRGWQEPASRPVMANEEDRRPGLELTSQGLLRDGRPWIPVSGEIHYSRVPRRRWAERLAQMRAGGITVVACYVPWLHHAPDGPHASFEENLDVGTFVDLVRDQHLDIVLRIGPWAHGELRNGGFPDWVQDADITHRTNDPAYLDLVGRWWSQLASALGDRLSPDTILGIQLENELYDQPDHIRRLKQLARQLGFTAPFWTATGWGHAQLPEAEVFPLYGGYSDGFWVDQSEGWHPSFRDHFFFSHTWDDPGIGADVRAQQSAAETSGPASELFPPATCELGGGMATAYHRRPRPDARDLAAVSQIKIGNGSSWQGYYMYAGGTNPGPDMQESHATGYPNDMVPLSYDFHASIGEAGRLARSHAEFRRQNAFLGAFGEQLGAWPSHLPDERPDGVQDASTLRWAFRGDDASGFLFISWHQPHVPLVDYEGARFTIRFPDDELTLPSASLTIPAGTVARWPVRLQLGGAELSWLTASPVTLLPGEVPTLVAVADEGIPVELALRSGDGHQVQAITPGLAPTRVAGDNGAFDLIVLPTDLADNIWVQARPDGIAERVLLSRDELTWTPTGRITVRASLPAPEVLVYDGAARIFSALPLAANGGLAQTVEVSAERVRDASEPPATYGTFEGRPSAPQQDVIDRLSAVYHLPLAALPEDEDAVIEIDWEGDIAQLVSDGVVVSDRFWDGSVWLTNAVDRGITATSALELRVLPLRADSPVHLPQSAQRRRDANMASLEAVRAVRIIRRATWVEAAPKEGTS